MSGFQHRIAIWEETKVVAQRFQKPGAFKHTYDPNTPINRIYPASSTAVYNSDSIELGSELKKRGYRPLVLIYADDRFAGGAVAMGSGAQEESLFRRTNLCMSLEQELFYPIKPTEAVVSRDVTVFRNTDYSYITYPYKLDFIACPGIHNPKVTDGKMNAADVQLLRNKIRCIFQAAQLIGCDTLVLGPLGCGAWKCPPEHVAQIFKEEIDNNSGAFAFVAFACLDVNTESYIVQNRGQVSNYTEFIKIMKK